jgi:hypothetical protein
MADKLATRLSQAIEELIEAKIGLQEALLKHGGPRDAIRRVSDAREELRRLLGETIDG